MSTLQNYAANGIKRQIYVAAKFFKLCIGVLFRKFMRSIHHEKAMPRFQNIVAAKLFIFS